MDVHIEGVSPDNTVPMTVTLEEIAPKGLNMGNYKLYHVENGQTVEMTYVASDVAFTAHNQFKYDPATGNMVLYVATFSEFAAVADTVAPWKGNIAEGFAGGTGTEEDPYLIANADQLAGFGAIVGGMVGKTEDSFEDKHIKLISDINLGDEESKNNPDIIFYPIGYYNSEGTYERTNTAITSGLKIFEGTFDGQGHTIANFYQNTWEMKGDHNWYTPEEQYYRDGMGLFGRVYKGTVKNLTVTDFSSDGEIATTGTIAAYADGATFENIAIFNCNPRVYNIGNGGIVGCVGWYAKEADLKTTFKNITVDNSNKISALWGSYDVACGGIVGQYYPTSGQSSANYPVNAGIHLVNCHVAAVMDVYNDVCANYQYYAYRYAGMMIGSIRENTTNEDGKTIPDMTGISATGCTVNYGDWNDYYYCEFEKNSMASYSEDYQFSRVPHSELNFTDSNGNGVVDANERASVTGCKHAHTAEENHQAIYLPFHQLFTGYGWGVSSIGLEQYSGITVESFGLDIEEGTQEESVVKFISKITTESDALVANQQYKISDLFNYKDACDVDLKPESVQVAVTGLNNSGIVGTFAESTTGNWEDGTLTFNTLEGLCTITIQDYFFCKPTTIVLKDGKLYDLQKFAIVFPNVDTYLYRVGNLNKINLYSLFEETGEALVNDADVTVTVTNGNGEEMKNVYTPNTSTWENGTLKFSESYTGPVRVTISEAGSFEKTLNLEVVDAWNITTATSQKDSNGNMYDVVLLNDVKIAANGTIQYTDCTVFGNGFTFDVCDGMNQYNSKQGHGIIIINNATLDHLRIVGDVYDEYGMYTTDLYGNVQNDYTSAVDATNSTIQNCYIANCATPVRSNGNIIIDTTLYGGTVANLLISGGTNTLTNVTTVNYNDGRGVIGMGIVITDGANVDGTKLILNGYLKQHNYVYESDVSEITVEEAKTVFNSMFGDKFADYHIGSNPKAVNTGIISINEGIKLTDTVFEDNVNTGYLVTNEVEIQISAQGVTKKVKANVASVPGNGGSVDNNFEDNGNEQGDYLPTFDFNLGDQAQAKDNDDDTRYLIGDKNGLSAMYPKGEAALTLDLTKLATVTKYTNVSYPVTAKCIGPDGKEQTGTVTLADKGTYTLVFTVDDNVHYDENGNKIEKSVPRTYEVTLVLDLYEKSIADATMTISSSNLTGEYVNSGSNKKYKMYPLKAITSIMDDANKDGVLETFDFTKNIQSAVLTPESNNAFSSPTTITITYTGGQVLTIVLGTPSGLNSPGASNGGKTFSVVTDSTNGIYLQSDGAIASSSAATGTWPLTSWSFKGTSGKVITNSTQVTIDFTKPSCVTGDTLVTLADGTQKRIDEVTYNDQLLVWNFFEGKYDVVPAAIIFYHGDDNYRVLQLNFSDGTKVKVLNNHGFYDVVENAFVFIDEENVDNYIGHSFVKVKDNSTKNVVLVSYEVYEEYTGCYSIQSAVHNNFMVEGMFSLTIPEYDGWFDYFEIGEDMKYDEAKMQADIEKYGLYEYSEFAEYVTYEQFVAFNGPYLKVLVGRGVVTYEQILELIATYVTN